MSGTVRVVATYPASDGSAPESIEVTWEMDDAPTSGEVAAIINALGRIVRRRVERE